MENGSVIVSDAQTAVVLQNPNNVKMQKNVNESSISVTE